ncbi:sugar porter family MFS transporter [Cytophagaceae bacterium ABcell3]|nr:sugar porter family MFS transporter [Cytophagaceae bacterium ABcell3]
MKNSVVLYAIVAAMGGFLFGFDTAVISGAEQAIQARWDLTDWMHGLAVAIALYGTVIGALLGGKPADWFGRKKTLIFIGIIYTISALGSAMAPEIYSFMIFRFIGGIGVGASSVTAPMYISEISPAKSRGKLVMLFQLNIVLGIFIAFLSNYALEGVSPNSWRYMLAIEAVPALAFTGLAFVIAESPRWLVLKKHDETAALQVLNKVNPGNEQEMLEQIKYSAKDVKGDEKLFVPRYSKLLVITFIFAFLNQVTGINAVLYYAPRIFEMTGLASEESLLSTSGIGLVNMLFTIVGMILIDRAGRKTLMYIGSIGMALSLAFLARAFFIDDYAGVAPFIFAFIAFFAMSHGAVIWVFLSEIFPNVVRAAGQSFGSLTHWIFAAIIANLFPISLAAFGAGAVFAFFATMMALQFFFIWKVMPETKGVPLEDIQKKLGIAGKVPEEEKV